MNNQEKNIKSPEVERSKESQKELLELGAEQHERLKQDLERSVENNSSEKLSEARHEALEKAVSHEVLRPKEEPRETSPAERRKAPLKQQAEANFNETMREIQGEMSGSSRAFSKVIHNKTVEKVSEVTGNTIAKPNAILSGAVCAFILTLGVYLLAKNTGYPLSGFETIGAFILGWILGLIYDFLRLMITGRQ